MPSDSPRTTSGAPGGPPASDRVSTGRFTGRRQIGELRSVVESEAGKTYLAEAYTGWPLPQAG
ncbi:hypothetical protein [Microbacterium kunmingense]|uniref:hypothetical protein n=1 Tax=Microbacterium kunmingense TaxID=2915939 RepID=UPI003D711A50